MKVKKLELREVERIPSGYKSIYLFINGKKTERNHFSLDENTNITRGGNIFDKNDCDKILSCSFLDLPDNSLIGSFPDKYLGTNISTLESITRKGKKLISNYYISVSYYKKGLIWNAEIYLEELTTNLANKGFSWKKRDRRVEDSENSFYSMIDYNHKNTKGTLLENVNECIELIKQAEKETHARMLKLAIAKGKKK
jgi:hypothetical protein